MLGGERAAGAVDHHAGVTADPQPPERAHQRVHRRQLNTGAGIGRDLAEQDEAGARNMALGVRVATALNLHHHDVGVAEMLGEP